MSNWSASMPETFQSLIAQGILEIGDGYRAKLNELGGDGPIFLRAGSLTNHGFTWEGNDRFHNHLTAKVQSKMGMPGDTVITTKGNSTGRTGHVPPDAPPFIYSPHLSYWRSVREDCLSPGFLRYWSRSDEFTRQLRSMAHGTDMAPYLSLTDQLRLKITLPPIHIQNATSAILGALDDKIAVNDRIAVTGRALAQAKFADALERPGAQVVQLSELVSELTRGVAPKYSEAPDELTVINQKCVRSGRVDLGPARKTLRERVSNTKLLRQGDVLVNSTGVGTLGRVAPWGHDAEATVDSHVTIVRFDPEKVDPVCGGYAMLAAQTDIEALGEGSTGQTELSRKRLGTFQITLPSKEAMLRLRPELDSLEARGNAALAESITLAELRDTLLPKLMSGEIRVRDAEKAVEDAL